MRYEQAKKEIIKLMQRISPRHGMHNVFRDFTTLAACTISNSVDKQQWQKREEKYMRTVEKYDRDEANMFAQILSLVVAGLSDRFGDFMGELYMELEISNSNSGQFFTPYDVSKLMAEMGSTPETDKQGFIKLNEPAVGSGGMVIAYAERLREKGINFQKQLKVTCNDIDFDVVRMCYIQLSLVGMDAVVMQGDTITQKFNEVWYTPMHLLNKVREEREKEAKSAIEGVKKATDLLNCVEYQKQEEPVQLSLF
ncbi:N-6 DNA methylase [Virgibacillus kimchii]